MNKETLQKYAELKVQIKALTEEADVLNKEILDSMIASNTDEVEIDEGKISITGRKTWTYPASVVEADAKLKDMKKQAERVGTATYTESFSIRFTPKGGEE